MTSGTVDMPDDVRAHRAIGPNFRGRLERGSESREIDSVAQAHVLLLRNGRERGAILGIVRVEKTGKARADRVVVRTDERIAALKIDVIGNGDELTRSDLLSKTTHRRRQNHRLASDALHRVHRHAHLLRIDALVEMDAGPGSKRRRRPILFRK